MIMYGSVWGLYIICIFAVIETAQEDATVNSKSANSTLDYSEYNVNESDDSVGQGQVWPERTSSITQSVAPDPSKSSGCSMNLDAFYAKVCSNIPNIRLYTIA